MNIHNTQSLQTIITFDFFNLFDKVEFENWYSNYDIDLHQFGNLNIYKNRKELYESTLLRANQVFDEKLESNIVNLLSVLSQYCRSYIDKRYTEADLIKAISFFYGNCSMKLFDELNEDTSKAFFELLEITEVNKSKLKTSRFEIEGACQLLINTVSPTENINFKINFDNLSTRLGIELPDGIRFFNFLDLGYQVSFSDCFKFKSDQIEITIDKFIERSNFEGYWKGRMGGDIWEVNKQYLGIATCINPYGFIVFSVNKSDFGSIWLEYTYEIENDDRKRILLAKSMVKFLEFLEPVILNNR